jgi:predicted transcriptional regulator
MDIKNSKLLLPISIMAVIAIILIVAYSIFQNFTTHSLEGGGLCPRMVPNYLLWLSLILMVVIIVPISYYVISKRLEEKLEKNLSAITKLVDHKVKSGVKKENLQTNNNGSILKLLNPNEKKVVDKIIENDGSALQSEISRMEGMTKLKTHRAVKELERKGIIKLEQYGKTNRIILTKDIKEVILK